MKNGDIGMHQNSRVNLSNNTILCTINTHLSNTNRQHGLNVNLEFKITNKSKWISSQIMVLSPINISPKTNINNSYNRYPLINGN